MGVHLIVDDRVHLVCVMTGKNTGDDIFRDGSNVVVIYKYLNEQKPSNSLHSILIDVLNTAVN